MQREHATFLGGPQPGTSGPARALPGLKQGKETAPMNSKISLAAAALAVAVLAAPAAQAQHHHGGWHHGGGWGGAAAGFAAGALIGGALGAASRPYYDYGPGYYGYDYAPGPVVVERAGGDAVAYCEQRFRSYDPASGTYLGYDGMRHPCP